MTATTETKFKYRIKAAFIDVFGSRAHIAKNLMTSSRWGTTHFIPLGTYNKDVNIRMSSSDEIIEQRLEKYAAFLGVTVDYLKADYLEFKKRKKASV